MVACVELADILRQRIREGRTRPSDDLPSGAPSPLDHLVRKEEVDRVRSALGRLPDRDRSLLRRFFVEGERLIDIARLQGEPAERIRKRKSRALARLRDEMGEIRSGHVSPELSTDGV